MEQNRPLIAAPVKSNPIQQSLISLDNPNVVITALKVSDDNQALIVRLRSLSNKTEKITLRYPATQPKSVFICTPGETPLQKSTGTVEMPQYGTVSLWMVFQ
ncbi:glycosyl hydrolase-related protein [Niastella koreensis]|nr:glycosyl hydrolase-related protein [Niastella koreensis]